ncbi:MAG: alkaline phosphatase family protein, partial [Ilumatobacteraceae bacterium]
PPVRALISTVLTCAAVAFGCGAASAAMPQGIHKIKHIVVIMQENRSFDSYFGTYPAPTGYRWPTANQRCAFPILPPPRA